MLRRVGGATLFATFVGLLAVGWVYRSARAQMSESLMDFGVQMMAYEGATHQDAPRQLVVNGQTIHLSSGTTTDDPMQVLSVFEERCASWDGDLGAQVAQLEMEEEGSQVPVLRADDGRTGYVACIDLGAQSIDLAEFGDRLARFGSTGDVSEIGEARYVFVEPTRHGAHFVAVWTAGEFNVDRMFPEEGDAPGRDVSGVSRPPASRRVLSGFERGLPHTMTVYASPSADDELERFYRDDLEANGWTLVPLATERTSAAPRTLIAERGERMVTLVLLPDAEGGGSSAAIFDVQ